MNKNPFVITNKTCKGKCSNCGECCSDILPLNAFEISRIRDYIKLHKIEECKHLEEGDERIDLTCPFRDRINNKCVIYPVRPFICKNFICSDSQEKIQRDKKLIHNKRKQYSMRNLFYKGKDLNLLFLDMLNILKGGK